ncbi:MAG TPA: hypothetical protein PLI09_16845 [Candidatus Hydrogenedentes bacterium]|nr:hypothetical protein [Candidatus Hydrogenedentota bacterium]
MNTITKLTLAVIVTMAVTALGAAFFGSAAAAPASSTMDSAVENAPATPAQETQTSPLRGSGYVDNDNDGVCDNRVAGQSKGNRRGYVDADGDGVCDNQGKGMGRRGNGRGGARGAYVDADGDGVCDNQGNGTCRRGNGRAGARRGYVDADGDGICDNQGAGAQQRRQGRGNGYGQGRGQNNR